MPRLGLPQGLVEESVARHSGCEYTGPLLASELKDMA